MKPYIVISRNGTGRKIKRTMVLRESMEMAKRDKPSWLVNNPFWQFVEVDDCTLADFWDALNEHDWHFEKADDHRSWKKGKERQAELHRARDHFEEDGHLIYQGFVNWINGKDEKPERPDA